MIYNVTILLPKTRRELGSTASYDANRKREGCDLITNNLIDTNDDGQRRAWEMK